MQMRAAHRGPSETFSILMVPALEQAPGMGAGVSAPERTKAVRLDNAKESAIDLCHMSHTTWE